jgi:ferredoxin
MGVLTAALPLSTPSLFLPPRTAQDRKAVVFLLRDMEERIVPQFDLSRCDRCGLCVERCPTSAVEMASAGPFIARPGDCTYCAQCEALCPQGAILCPYEIVWETTPSEEAV